MTYQQQWRDYKVRRIMFWFAFLTYIPGIIVISVLLTLLLRPDQAIGLVVIGVVAFVWTVAVAVTGVYQTRWKCPRCHQPFQKWRYYNPTAIAWQCEHCGLPIGAAPDEPVKS